MKERPILFSGGMIRAILENRKTQTRRIVKPQPEPCDAGKQISEAASEPGWFTNMTLIDGTVPPERMEGDFPREDFAHRWWACPYGKPGDRLWVRETWQQYRASSPAQDAAIKKSIERIESGKSKDIVAEVGGWPMPNGEARTLYAADFGEWAYNVDSDLKPWRPSIFMPRALSRITLEITNVRVERLQEISEMDAKAEGVEAAWGPNNPPFGYKQSFEAGWDSINGKRGSWASNPWVWVIEFKKQ